MTDMSVNEVLLKMLRRPEETLEDINHLMKVYTFAGCIARGEGLSDEEVRTTELSAILHDISCPLCRKLYGNTHWSYQEAHGETLIYDFFQGEQMPENEVKEIAYIVSHHHTYSAVNGTPFQILYEADFLVNAGEQHYEKTAVLQMRNEAFRTKTGIELLHTIYL